MSTEAASNHRVRPQWIVQASEPEASGRLVAALGISPFVATLLVNRGIVDPEDAEAFLHPRLGQMADPALMAGMDRAVPRILDAVEAGESICVWGDYDVDGVTSAAQLHWFFRALNIETRVFVPDRFEDGYGLSARRIEELAADGVQLLITVDCGISNVDEIASANALGMDVIVVDHHQIPPILPPAHAILNPLQVDCGYPDKRLAACGVAFVLCVALRKALGERPFFADIPRPDLREWLDLTAIGTVADMVPLTGLNRVIVKHGLKRIASSTRAGVRALLQVSKVRPDAVSAGQIGFKLGPRINAAGRVAHASAGVQLLITEDADEALDIAEEVDAYNLERRGIQDAIETAAIALVEAGPNPAERRAIVLASEGWHPGVLGIVASRLKERYHRPTVLLSLEDGLAKGSARSIRGFKLVAHLNQLDALLIKYGGHDHAAGMSLDAANVEAFAEGLDALARIALRPEHLLPRLKMDAEVSLDRINTAFLDEVAQLAPYGMGNPEPWFFASDVKVLDSRCVGADGSHLKLTVESGGAVLDAIAFGLGADIPAPGTRIDLAYRAEVNEWQGRRSMQLRVKALRPSTG